MPHPTLGHLPPSFRPSPHRAASALSGALLSPPPPEATVRLLPSDAPGPERCLYSCSSMASPSRKVTMTRSVDLQLRRFLKYTTRVTRQDKLIQKVNEIHSNLLEFSVLQEIKGRIESVIQDLESSADIVFKDQRSVSDLLGRQNAAHFLGCQPTFFIQEFGPKITSMEKMCRENYKILEDLETGLHLYFDRNDPLLSKVQSLQTSSNEVSKTGLGCAGQFSRYQSRVEVELLWISEFPKTLEMCSEQLAISMQTLIDLQNALFEKSNFMDDLESCKDASQHFGSQFRDLHALLRTLKATELMSWCSADVMQSVAHLSSHCKNLVSLYQEKEVIAMGFIGCEKFLKKNIPEVEESLNELHLEVTKVKKLYDAKFRRLPKDALVPEKGIHVFKKACSSDISWRIRTINKMNISPVIRRQGRGQCAYVSTTSCTESHHKRKCAALAGGGSNEANEFTLKLSHDHLHDLVTAYRETNSRKGWNTLDYCLDRMEMQGVVTEEAYDDAKESYNGFQRYRIKGFEKLNTAGIEEAKEIIMKGEALIGNFRITTEYHRLGRDDIYDIPKGAVFETNSVGQISSHCVVILGYGMSREGLAYYIFQNSYGPSWGADGFGRIACGCLKHLYRPKV